MRTLVLVLLLCGTAAANPMSDRETVLGAVVVAFDDGSFVADADPFSSMEACEKTSADLRAKLNANARVVGYVMKCGKVKVPRKSGA